MLEEGATDVVDVSYRHVVSIIMLLRVDVSYRHVVLIIMLLRVARQRVGLVK
jgi:hypothetical protein